MNIKQTFILFTFIVAIISCEKQTDDNFRDVNVAIPITMDLKEFRSAVSVQPPKAISEAGKIYAYKNYLFVNDQGIGIHIIDNSNPANPIKIKFISIPANMDIAIKNNFLYADSGIDLVVLDINDLTSITEIGRLKDVFSHYYPPTPTTINYIDFDGFDNATQIITGYTTENRREKIPDIAPEIIETFDGGLINTVSNSTGTGGSLARFNIVDHYLYTVDTANLSVFDIKNLNDPKILQQQYIGWNIETIFNQEEYMYIGSTTGMLIYDIKNRAMPEHQSTINHLLACDPVVVQGDYAYVTLRGGNFCGQPDSMLEVIDIKDKKNPELLQTYPMKNPYGLGIKDNLLFVCDGTAGLRVFDATNTPTLKQVQQFEQINTKDVIPLAESLLMIGDQTIYQYTYEKQSIKLLSSFSLN